MERVTQKYAFFWGGLLSNFSNCTFGTRFGDNSFTVHNSEQAFMACKALYFKDFGTAIEILQEPHPGKCKKWGRRVRNYGDIEWAKVRYSYMVAVNYDKYSQSDTHRAELARTGDRIIVEASPNDLIWGIGLHWSDNDVLYEHKWRGQNLLGKALMDIRKRLQEEGKIII